MRLFRKFHLFQVIYEIKVFPHLHIYIQRRYFGKVSDAALRVLRIFRNIVAVDNHLALSKGKISGKDIHYGGFSGAVRS